MGRSKNDEDKRCNQVIPKKKGLMSKMPSCKGPSPANPERAALDLEAGKGAHFTGTNFIFKLKMFRLLTCSGDSIVREVDARKGGALGLGKRY